MINQPKVARWAEREITKYLDQIILPHNKKNISVFGRFDLRHRHDKVHVAEHGVNRATFSDVRTALSWCVAIKFHEINLARSIAVLDEQRRITDQDIKSRRDLALNSKHLQFRDTVLTKLENKIQYRANVASQLEKCINLTKYLQLKGFQNETARIRCV